MGNILFICGSLNHTTQMHKIARHSIQEHDCYFTPYYGDGFVNLLAKIGWLNFTVLGGRHKRETEGYLSRHNLQVDPRGEARSYDLVVTCSDLLIQKNIRGKRVVLVQEGITEPEGIMFHLVKWLKLPRYLANTSTNGLSNEYDAFCVASRGYAELFVRKGVHERKIIVTGIPNFDNMKIAHFTGMSSRLHHLCAKPSVMMIGGRLFRNAATSQGNEVWSSNCTLWKTLKEPFEKLMNTRQARSYLLTAILIR